MRDHQRTASSGRQPHWAALCLIDASDRIEALWPCFGLNQTKSLAPNGAVAKKENFHLESISPQLRSPNTIHPHTRKPH